MKAVILFASMLFCMESVLAQTNYYTETKTFHENGYTYQCDVEKSGFVTLYNKSSKWVYKQMVYKDIGRPYTDDDTPDIYEEISDEFSHQCDSIINNAFSTEEKRRIKDIFFILMLYANSETGVIEDVVFVFVKIDPYATVPVSVYRKIEVGIKQKLRLVPTAEGRRLNYLFCWNHLVPE